jgi:hypothetical protein
VGTDNFGGPPISVPRNYSEHLFDPVRRHAGRYLRSGGTPKSSQTARQTSLGDIPASIAWSAVRPPRAPSTWSLASISARTAPNSPAIRLRKTVVRIAGYSSEVLQAEGLEAFALWALALASTLTALLMLIRAWRNRR